MLFSSYGRSGDTPDQVTHLEDTEGRENSRDGETCFGNELVDRSRVVANRCQDLLLEIVQLELGRVAYFRSVIFWGRMGQGAKMFEDIVDRLDKSGTVAEKAMATLGRPVVDASGNGKNFAILLGGESGCDQGAATSTRLNNHSSQRQAADDAISLRKAPCPWGRMGWGLAEQGPAFEDFLGKRVVFGWVDVQDATAEDSDGSPASGQSAAVGGCVNPTGKTADHRDSRSGKASGESLGLPKPVMGRVTCTDDRYGQAIRGAQTASDEEKPRGIVNLLECGGVCVVVVWKDLNRVLTAEIQLGVDIRVLLCERDGPSELCSDAGYLPETIHGCRQNPFRRIEPSKERLANPWPHTRDHRQKKVVPELLVVTRGISRLAFRHD